MSRGDPSSHEITARGLLLDLDVNRNSVLTVLLDVRNSRVSDWNGIREVLITLLCWDDPDSIPTEQDLEPWHTLWRRADQVKRAERDAEFEAELAAMPQIPSRPPTLPTWVRPVESHARPPRPTASAGPLLRDVLIFAGTASLIPYLQAIASEAGSRTFARLSRVGIRFRPRRLRTQEALGPKIAVAQRATGLRFEMPSTLPTEALEALATTDLEQLAGPPTPEFIFWDSSSRSWRRQESPGASPSR